MSVRADRNLLFGLIALQNGMIDQSALVAAFHAWTRDKNRAISEILLGRAAIDADDQALLEGLVNKHLKRHGDDVEKSLAAVPTPRAVVTGLVAMGDHDVTTSLGNVGSGLRPTVADDRADAEATTSVGSPTGAGQRFRALRPHARGGLGAVFVALDAELNREVALKQILDHHADDPTSRTRFVLEAEITGGLEHPGIVPVYGLGSDGGGRPYYAMRFIRGESLKEAIAAFHGDPAMNEDAGKRSLALRKLLRRFTDVCNAIEYAHTRGVIHRDIKPANIIVGKYGETLVVDWGLAKATGKSEPALPSDERTLTPSSASGSVETQPGSALGTPAYMSPEQAAGDLDRLGPRSDVYSLGATLYCLLTGNPPFEGDDIGAVLRAVGKGDFPRPRSVDPSIDPALEAVCLKAMATNLEDRYASCRALADDVERWAADEPTAAWPEPFSVRTRRWMRRNRTTVTAASAAVLVAIVGLAGVLAVQARANGILQAKNFELDQANRREAAANSQLRDANTKVQARFELAREAIRSFQNGVNEDDMLKNAELKGLRNKLLRSAAGFYEKLEKLLQGQTDRASRAILAQSYFELGELTDNIGVLSEALVLYNKAMAIRRELASGPDSDDDAKLELAKSLNAVGLTYLTGDNAGALSAFEEARSLAGPLAEGSGATDAARHVLATSYHRIGNVLLSTGKLAKAMESYRKALTVRQTLADRNPAVAAYHNRLADSHYNIAMLLSQTGKPAEALEWYRRALATYQKLAKDNPDATEFRGQMTSVLGWIGILQFQTGQPAEALESYRQALAIAEKLVHDNPAVTEFREKLSESYHNIGMLQSKTDHPTEALESFHQALAIQEKLAGDNPDVTYYRQLSATSHDRIGTTYENMGRRIEAGQSFRMSLQIRRKLADDNPADTAHQANLSNSYEDIGRLARSEGKWPEALEFFRRAVAIERKLAEDNPTATDYRDSLALGLDEIGTTYSLIGQPTEAAQNYRMALEIRKKLADDNPALTHCQIELAASYENIGQLLDWEGKSPEALDFYRRALAIQERLAADNPALSHFRNGLAFCLDQIGSAQMSSGRLAEAVEAFSRASAIQEKLASDNPSSSDYRRNLAICLNNNATLALRLGKPDEARAKSERAVSLLETLAREEPATLEYRWMLAKGYLRFGQAREARGDHAGAATDWKRAVALLQAIPSLDVECTFAYACCHAKLAGLGIPGMSADEASSHAETAINLLKKAVRMGFRSVDHFRTETALDPLRGRDDFQLLMMDLAFPAKPFVAGSEEKGSGTFFAAEARAGKKGSGTFFATSAELSKKSQLSRKRFLTPFFCQADDCEKGS